MLSLFLIRHIRWACEELAREAFALNTASLCATKTKIRKKPTKCRHKGIFFGMEHYLSGLEYLSKKHCLALAEYF